MLRITVEQDRAIMLFQWVSAHISGFNIAAPIEYACAGNFRESRTGVEDLLS